jgi:hypothetical protein
MLNAVIIAMLRIFIIHNHGNYEFISTAIIFLKVIRYIILLIISISSYWVIKIFLSYCGKKIIDQREFWLLSGDAVP